MNPNEESPFSEGEDGPQSRRNVFFGSDGGTGDQIDRRSLTGVDLRTGPIRGGTEGRTSGSGQSRTDIGSLVGCIRNG